MGREARLRSVDAPTPEARPEIVLTLGQIIQAHPVIERLCTARVPAVSAYRFAKLARALAPEVSHFNAQREALIREYGQEREATEVERAGGASSIYEVKREHLATFGERMGDLAAVSAHLDVSPLTIEDLGSVEVSGADLLALGSLVALDVD